MIRDCARCGEPMFGGVDVCPSCGQPGDVASAPLEVLAEGDRRDPGLAFLISVAVPGSGQFYAGARKRGIATLAILVASVLLAAWQGLSSNLGATGFRAAFFLYVFGFLDAYFTAAEVNRGLGATFPENPRVAAILNMVAPGFGYFYLMQRTKGLLFFFAFRVPGVLLNVGLWLGIVVEVLAALIAIDAYRLAARSRSSALARAPGPEAVATGLPAFVPLGCGALLVGGYFVLMAIGLVLLLIPRS